MQGRHAHAQAEKHYEKVYFRLFDFTFLLFSARRLKGIPPKRPSLPDRKPDADNKSGKDPNFPSTKKRSAAENEPCKICQLRWVGEGPPRCAPSAANEPCSCCCVLRGPIQQASVDPEDHARETPLFCAVAAGHAALTGCPILKEKLKSGQASPTNRSPVR